MNIGNLKHRIAILDFVETESKNGFVTKTWTEKSKAWAEIINYKHSIIEENEKQTFEENLTFIFRFQEINEKQRISYKNKVYEIVAIEEKDFARRFLSVSVKGVV